VDSKNWIIHIGAQKTGSKALQLFLEHELAGLRRNLYFAHSGREALWHEPLFDSLERGDRSFLIQLGREAEERTGQIGIISYEGLFGLPPDKVKMLFDGLGPAKIVLFMRRQDDLLNSLFNQWIKAHRTTIRDVDEFESGLTKYSAIYDYWVIIEKWASVFGEVNVLPCIYTKSRSVVDSFFAKVGMPVDGVRSSANPNQALDSQGLSVMRHVKRLARKPEDLPALVEKAHRRLRGHFVDTAAVEYYILDSTIRGKIMENYAEGTEWVRQTYYPGRSFLFPPPNFHHFNKVDWSHGEAVAREILATESS
jgi:hypothetical protein